jgi:hypothetical protein
MQIKTSWICLMQMASAWKASGKSLLACAYRRIPESMYRALSYLRSILMLRRYTYEVCLFDEAKQIPNKGGSNFSLGYVVHDEC